MIMVLLSVFVCVFAVAAILIVATLPRSSAQSEADSGLSASRSKKPTMDFSKNQILSAIPWINRLLQKYELAPRLRMLLFQANVSWTTGRLILSCLACFMVSAYLMYWKIGILFLALVIGLVVAFAPFAFVFFKRSQRFGKFEQDLPDALDLMVSALRAGHSFNAALGLASRECSDPIRGEFQICFAEQNYGLELREAMDNMNVRVPLQDLRIATTAILIQKETGGNLAEVLNKTSEVIRERFRLKKQVRVHTAHGRMTGYVIGVLPLALLVALYVVNPAMESLLWKSSLGVKLLYTSGTMMVIGGLIIRKITGTQV